MPTMTENAVRFTVREYFPDVDFGNGMPPKELAANVPYEVYAGSHSMGKKGMRALVAWLAEDGFVLVKGAKPKGQWWGN